MAKTICMVLAVALLFSVSGPFSFLPLAGANLTYAQATAPGPEKSAKPRVSIKGGPGDTPETAVVISGAPNSSVGIDAEYYFLMKKFGQPNVDWKLKRQSVLHKNAKHYDRMELEMKDGSKKTIFFDITEFFGKL